jgi:hypothetical protein
VLLATRVEWTMKGWGDGMRKFKDVAGGVLMHLELTPDGLRMLETVRKKL